MVCARGKMKAMTVNYKHASETLGLYVPSGACCGGRKKNTRSSFALRRGGGRFDANMIDDDDVQR
jgi:hypothetical protein